MRRVCCWAPRGIRISIDSGWCQAPSSNGTAAANAGSVTLTAAVAGWTQTCIFSISTLCRFYFFSSLHFLYVARAKWVTVASDVVHCCVGGCSRLVSPGLISLHWLGDINAAFCLLTLKALIRLWNRKQIYALCWNEDSSRLCCLQRRIQPPRLTIFQNREIIRFSRKKECVKNHRKFRPSSGRRLKTVSIQPWLPCRRYGLVDPRHKVRIGIIHSHGSARVL